jgi:hypothetical protein
VLERRQRRSTTFFVDMLRPALEARYPKCPPVELSAIGPTRLLMLMMRDCGLALRRWLNKARLMRSGRTAFVVYSSTKDSLYRSFKLWSFKTPVFGRIGYTPFSTQSSYCRSPVLLLIKSIALLPDGARKCVHRFLRCDIKAFDLNPKRVELMAFVVSALGVWRAT